MKLVSAFILSRLDYCNAVLAGLSKSTTACPTPAGTKRRGSSSNWHWTPRSRHSSTSHTTTWSTSTISYIAFRLCLPIHEIHAIRASSYRTDKVNAVADLQSRVGLRFPSTANIRLQGHVSNLASEVFHTRDLLRGTVFRIKFKK